MNFFVPGIPRPQGSKRAFVNKKTGGVILTESGGQAHKDWRAVVALAAQEAMSGEPPLDGPIALDLYFYLPRPKSHPKTRVTWPIARPDADKLARSVLDALTHICFNDDAQVVALRVFKRWSFGEKGPPVGVTVWLAEGQHVA